MDTYLIGLDIAKNVFTAHAIDQTGKPLFRKKLSRAELVPFFASIPVSTIAMEACGGAHHWARSFQELVVRDNHLVRFNDKHLGR